MVSDNNRLSPVLFSRNIQNTLTHDATRLTEALLLDFSTARIEVQALLRQVLNVSRAYLLANPERCLNDSEQTRYDELLQRRLRGEPIAYLLGEREFFGLMFKVTPATLIPRPETELLVELALQRVPFFTHEPQAACIGGNVYRVLDLGTGSGAIALSIAHARPDIEVVAVDASSEALAVARENAQQLGISNATFMQSDWYTALNAQRFDLIVSNPPYVEVGDPHLQRGDLRFEPTSALASGGDGLRDIRLIVTHAQAHLCPEGWLLLEHGYNQAAQVHELMRHAGFSAMFSACDLAGIARVSGGRAHFVSVPQS
jgi:release factor glutamine methyltransferase